MALFEDVFKNGGVPGLALGIGALVLAPVLLPAVARVARPMTKTMMKTGIMFYRQTLAGLGEEAGKLVEEARAELEAEGRQAPAAAGRAAKGERGRGHGQATA